MDAWAQSVPPVPEDYGYLVALLVAVVPVLVGALVWMERRWVKREEEARTELRAGFEQRIAEQKVAYEARLADHVARLAERDALIAAQREELKQTGPLLQGLSATLATLVDRVGRIEAQRRRAATRRGP